MSKKSIRNVLRDYSTASGLFIVAYHLALAIGLPVYFYYNQPGLGLLLTSVALLFLTEIGIGAAYHRFYSHRAYEMSRPAESVLLTLATVALQGSVLRWCYEHRLHHAYTDTDRDPYSISKGFWYAHFLWLFDKPKPIEDKRVADLLQNPLVRFQHRYYGQIAIGSNIALWLGVGWLFGDFLGAFVLTWWTRLFLSHHLTWFVNSLAHCWGERTFSKEQSAVDNYILAFLTVGEGYHNYHHTFASDYRNGVRWYHFDPVKWTIWTLSKIGMARNLRRYSTHVIKRRLLLEDRKLLLARLRSGSAAWMKDLEARVQDLAGTMQQKIDRARILADEIKTLRKQRARARVEAARTELRALKQSLRRDWRSWSMLVDRVLQTDPVPA